MPNDPPSRTPQRAMRLIFEYEGDQLNLVGQYPVTMVVHQWDPEQYSPGVYVEARSHSRGNASLARVRAPDELTTMSAEVFPAEPGGRIYRVDVPRRGAFTVVVPAPAEADHVAVVQVATEDMPLPSRIRARAVTTPDGVQATATDVAEFSLRKD